MTSAPYAIVFKPKASSTGRAEDMTIFIDPISYVCRIGAENKVSHKEIACKTLRAKYLKFIFDVILSVHLWFSVTVLFRILVYCISWHCLESILYSEDTFSWEIHQIRI